VTRHSEGDYPARPFQIVQSFKALVLTNRGGTVKEVPAPSAAARHTPCFAPSEMLVVTSNGDVLLCYEDAERSHPQGNILEQHVAEIWSSARLTGYRQRLRLGDRSLDPMCLRCSNVSHARPGLSALEDPVLAANNVARSDNSVRILKERSVAGRRKEG
jgi:cyclic pyranopterin phosphate synthase